MHLSTYLVALAAPFFVAALPARLNPRTSADLTVLTFADVLEQLESQFYSQALQKFQASDFTAAGFADPNVPIQQFTAIQSDESTHSKTLQAAIQSLGGTPLTSCTFDFSSVLTDVATMASVARVVENLGVAAYIGGATLITDNSQLLASAASILTVEARHQTVLNIFGDATVIPQAFDIAFLPPEVLAVASPFISGCDLGLPANPTLTITNTGTVSAGTQLTFSSTALNSSVDTSSLFCQMLIASAESSITLPYDACVVPSTVNGPVAIYITSDNQPLLLDVVVRATNSVVAGPTMAFIDANVDDLSSLVRTSSSSANPSSSSSSSSGSSSSGSSSTDSSSSGSAPSSSSSTSASDSSNASTDSASASSSSSTASATDVESSTAITTTIPPSSASAILASATAAAVTLTADAGNNAAAPVATPSGTYAGGAIVFVTGGLITPTPAASA